MEKILISKKGKERIETRYNNLKNQFEILYIENDKETVVETFKDLQDIIPLHFHWCRATNLIPSTYKEKNIPLQLVENLQLSEENSISA